MSELRTIVADESVLSPVHDVTYSELVTDHQLLETAANRDLSRSHADDAAGIHLESQIAVLEGMAQTLELKSTSELLEHLGDDCGFAWSSVARGLGVTPTAIRKWRRGEDATPANHKSVAFLVAFVDHLTRLAPQVSDPAHWLETPVISEASVTRLDLYRAHEYSGLLDIATQRKTGREVLDLSVPNWRDSHGSSRELKITWNDDGSPSIVHRGP